MCCSVAIIQLVYSANERQRLIATRQNAANTAAFRHGDDTLGINYYTVDFNDICLFLTKDLKTKSVKSTVERFSGHSRPVILKAFTYGCAYRMYCKHSPNFYSSG